MFTFFINNVNYIAQTTNLLIMFIGVEEIEFIEDRNTITVVIKDLIIDSDYYFVKNNLLGNYEYKYAMRAIYKFLLKNKIYPVCYIDFYGDE